MEITTETVVVVTGASSGIGRITTLKLLEAGASVVACSRPSELLNELARDAEALPGRLVAVEGDVADSGTARRLAGVAVESFGHLDVWVNNAAVMAFGAFNQVPEEAFRRVIDVNLHGYANGARAALDQFRRQGRGLLVNVSSVLGKLSGPNMSPYVASKFAIQGMCEVLRCELTGSPIRVCNVLPGGVNTSLYRDCANYTGRNVRPLYPLQRAEAVAETVLKTIRRPRRERRVGRAARVQLLAHLISPKIYEQVVGRVFPLMLFGRDKVPAGPGNLFEPAPAPRPGMKPRGVSVWGSAVKQEAEHVAQPH
ncbi:MAG TPA: SDR family NAD(P)-dependent oxidoreductase [Actinomycetota bacterium]|nr:SDR family NAD(P)-dependent oxidoreductase [Actinomycetota bacterium]